MYQDKKYFVMSRNIVMELCKLMKRENYYYLKCIAQIAFKYFLYH